MPTVRFGLRNVGRRRASVSAKCRHNNGEENDVDDPRFFHRGGGVAPLPAAGAVLRSYFAL